MDQYYSTNRPIFNFLTESHPFYNQISLFEGLIQRSSAYSKYLARKERGLSAYVHAEVKTKQDGKGRYLDRFYYSIQYPDHHLPGGLYAWSLHYSLSDGLNRIYEFPNDPKLTHLPAFINSPENRGIKVLRYVPLRRVTFCTETTQGLPNTIGKLKKPNRCIQGYGRLVDIAGIADQKVCAIPEPKGLDPTQSVFYQERVPGVEAGLILNRQNFYLYLYGMGKLHAQLHTWPITSDKPWDREGVIKNIWQDLDEIMFFLPQIAPFLEKISNWIKQREHQQTGTQKAFCHGDFACSQILIHDEGWSVVDFDLAGWGDRYQDMAMFLVSLGYDVDLFMAHVEFLQPAYEAYLEGYQDVNQDAFDVEKFNWYLVCAEIYYLSLILRKDRFTRQALGQAQHRLSLLTDIQVI